MLKSYIKELEDEKEFHREQHNFWLQVSEATQQPALEKAIATTVATLASITREQELREEASEKLRKRARSNDSSST